MSDLSVDHVKLELEVAKNLYDKHFSQAWDSVSAITFFSKRICYPTSFLYAFCRHFKPEIVVETGVHGGSSSAFILKALKDNNRGRLYSIDLPNNIYVLDGQGNTHFERLPTGKQTGFVVPNHLRDRWTLIFGDAKKELPLLMDRLGSLDIFYHDSMHTYEHMYFEFENVWQKIRQDGLLVSDDVLWNIAFPHFCEMKGVRPEIVLGVGFVIKRH